MAKPRNGLLAGSTESAGVNLFAAGLGARKLCLLSQPSWLSALCAVGYVAQGPARLSGPHGRRCFRMASLGGQAVPTTRPRRPRALAPTASCAATQMSAHTPGAHRRAWATHAPGAHPAVLAAHEAHLGAAPRAGSSAPPRRGTDSRARRTRHLRPSCPRKVFFPSRQQCAHPHLPLIALLNDVVVWRHGLRREISSDSAMVSASTARNPSPRRSRA
jgi:hypothetical protein